jgi:hypothetical protein
MATLPLAARPRVIASPALPPKPWPSLLSREGLELSSEVLHRARSPELAALLNQVARSPCAATSSTTRQALHARLQRMQSTITAGSLILATRSELFADFLLSSDFALLRPISAGTHVKLRHLIHDLPPIEPSGCRFLFEHCFSALARLSQRLVHLPDADVLRIDGALAGMHLGPVLFGPQFIEQWSHAFATMQRLGLLEHPYLHMQLNIMGSYVGEWRAHCEWLASPAHRELDAGRMYLFVRRDFSPEIAELHARLVRGDPVSARACLYSPRPWSTLNLLVDYIAGCLREPGHLESPGLTLMDLSWLEELDGQVARLADTPAREGDWRGLKARLAKIDRIQVMEKRRFWEMVEGPLPLELRMRLLALWSQTYAKGTQPNEKE